MRVVEKWPQRLTSIPPRIHSGSIPKITLENFDPDTQHWKFNVSYYGSMTGELNEGRYHNIMDMNAYNVCGFIVVLDNDLVWIMNVVLSNDNQNTFIII
jgi:hypothetical protein